MPLVTSADTVLCEKADRAELVAKNWTCNAVPLSVAPANYFIDVWSKEVPELDLYSALNGSRARGPVGAVDPRPAGTSRVGAIPASAMSAPAGTFGTIEASVNSTTSPHPAGSRSFRPGQGPG